MWKVTDEQHENDNVVYSPGLKLTVLNVNTLLHNGNSEPGWLASKNHYSHNMVKYPGQCAQAPASSAPL